jgi:Holliday junction DNA helicase RuvA
VGYLLKISVASFDGLGAVGSQQKMLTHLAVGEDHQTLFGFTTVDERKLFRFLLSVNGIGPVLALTILSSTSPEQLRSMIISEDDGRLKKIKGIGPKTAKRMVVELKSAMESLHLGDVVQSADDLAQRAIEDAQLALISLGYKRDVAISSITKICSSLEADQISVDTLVKLALKQ